MRTGGPAFPSGSIREQPQEQYIGAAFHVTEKTRPVYPGMTLRDYFAAKAMQALISLRKYSPSPDEYFDIARAAYKIADEMVEHP